MATTAKMMLTENGCGDGDGEMRTTTTMTMMASMVMMGGKRGGDRGEHRVRELDDELLGALERRRLSASEVAATHGAVLLLRG